MKALRRPTRAWRTTGWYCRHPLYLLLALGLGLGACGDSGPSQNVTGPDDEPPTVEIEAPGTSASIQVINDVFDTPAFHSLVVLGPLMGSAVDDAAPTGSARVDALARAHADLEQSAAPNAQIARRLLAGTAPRLASTMAEGVIQSHLLGGVYTYRPGTRSYRRESSDGPSNGVRFILYTVDRETLEISIPLVPVGHVDFLDETGPNPEHLEGETLRVVVMSEGQTLVDYAAGPPASGPALWFVDGYLTDGLERIDFEHDVSLEILPDFDFRIDVNFDVWVRERGFHFFLGFHSGAEGHETARIEAGYELQGTLAVTLTGGYGPEGTEVTVSVRSDTFSGEYATVRMNEGVVDVVRTGGEAMTPAEREAIEDAFELIGRFLTWSNDLLAPVEMFFYCPQQSRSFTGCRLPPPLLLAEGEPGSR
jgi:hypothetical protein